MFTDKGGLGSSWRGSSRFGEEGHRDSLVLLLGLNYRDAPIEVREQLAISEDSYADVLTEVLRCTGIQGAVVISTCNRVELFVAGSLHSDAPSLMLESMECVLERVSGLSRDVFSNYLYSLTHSEAIAHLFRVGAGLDSMVPGEPQVLGQVKTAYHVAQTARTTTMLLDRIFHRTFRVAKRVRTRTKIGHQPVSICYAAKELAQQIFGDLQGASLMLIGAGEMGTLALKHFASAGVRRFFVVNKTFSKAVELAESVGGVPLTLDLYRSFLSQADIVVGAATVASADAHLVSHADASRAQRNRPKKVQFYIDLGVPRNFAADIDELANAFLYNVDDLDGVVEKNLDCRRLELGVAEEIVKEEVVKFSAWIERRSLDPLIREVTTRGAEFKFTEIEKTLRRLRRSGFTAEQCSMIEAALDDLSDSLLAKMLHIPIQNLRDSINVNPERAKTFEELFLGNAKPR